MPAAFATCATTSDVEQRREARMKALKKLTVAEKRTMRDIMARAERRDRGEEIETEAVTLPDGEDWNGGENSNGSK